MKEAQNSINCYREAVGGGGGGGRKHTMDRADLRLVSALGNVKSFRADISLISALFAQSRKHRQFNESAVSAFGRGRIAT